MPSVVLPVLWVLEAPLPHAQLQLLCFGLLLQQIGKPLALEVPEQLKVCQMVSQAHCCPGLPMSHRFHKTRRLPSFMSARNYLDSTAVHTEGV